ncbi:hypothetical protein ABEB36_012622 [Hypothenemus hampei]|uniref:Uncharacterized protein n=1 Tax=Hypothenemus hampei TaxID=57062 RepID=A0ABD1EC07_HYPHA
MSEPFLTQLTKKILTNFSSLLSSGKNNENIDFRKNEDRLKSYDNWPIKEISKEVLAKAGFYYTNYNDVVRCPFCSLEMHRWIPQDDPMEDHRRFSPTCPFVTNIVDLTSAINNRNVDTCGLYGIEVLNSSTEDENGPENLALHEGKGPKHPDKIDFDVRLNTFLNPLASWPRSMKQKPHVLAKAGFYYVGMADQVICFYCGGMLANWKQKDDPWEQHALWFPECPYLLQQKGSDYIKNVKENRDPLAASTSSRDNPRSETEETININLLEQSSESKSSLECVSHTELSEKPLCKICYKNEMCVLFKPCNHIISCIECSWGLKTCGVCRKPIERRDRVFLS